MRNTVLGTLLLAGLAASCGQAPQKAAQEAYLAYHAAVESKDLQGARQGLTREPGRFLEGPDASKRLASLAQRTPDRLEVVAVQAEGKAARLTLQADDGRIGIVRMEREDEGAWKVAREEWKGRLVGEGLPVPFASLKGHQDSVTQLEFTPDGRFLVSASNGDYSVRTWNPDTGAQLSQARLEQRPLAVCVTADSVLTLEVGGNVIVRPLAEGKLGDPRLLTTSNAATAAASPDGTLLALAGPSGVQLLRLPGGESLGSLSSSGLRSETATALDPPVTRLAFSPDGDYLGGAGADRAVLWKVSDWSFRSATLNKVQKDMQVGGLRFSPDSCFLLVAHLDSSVVALRVPSLGESFNVYVSQVSALSAEASPEGNFVTGGQDGNIYLWASDGKRAGRLGGHKGFVESLTLSPYGDTLASGGQDRQILLWRVGEQALPKVVEAKPTHPVERGPAEATDVLGQRNYLRNPRASQGNQNWRSMGEASVEEGRSSTPGLAVRHGGSFWQDVVLPRQAPGKVVVMAGWVSSQRINPDGDITGLPYLYGYAMEADPEGKIHDYLQGDSMRCQATEPDAWTPVYGVFELPDGTRRVRFFLNQASGRSSPTDSAARFDDLGLFFFSDRSSAEAFVQDFKAAGQ